MKCLEIYTYMFHYYNIIIRGARYCNFLHTIYCCLKYHDITNYHNIYTLCPADLKYATIHAVKQNYSKHYNNHMGKYNITML